MLASMIFRKEPFFHGHDNYDQVNTKLGYSSIGISGQRSRESRHQCFLEPYPCRSLCESVSSLSYRADRLTLLFCSIVVGKNSQGSGN